MASGKVKFKVREFTIQLSAEGTDLESFKNEIYENLSQYDIDNELLDRVYIVEVIDFKPDVEEDEEDKSTESEEKEK
jgi:hypothetical protein